jgi:hypothetical protein
MKFKLIWDYRDKEREIEVNSLEELRDLPERFAKTASWNWEPPYDLVVDFEEMTITVYDNYLE